MTRYSGPEKRIQDSWHLDKKVPISIILLLFTQGVSGLWVIADIKKDVEILKVQNISQKETHQILRGQLEKMDQKLDRLIEKR